MRVYEGRLPLYHFDFYRLEGTGRAVDLEFDEYLEAGGVCVIEWPRCAPELIPADHLRVTLRVAGETARRLEIDAAGPHHAALLNAVRGEVARSATTP
jgi:tRNA threonylcarbamoyladenosine biosynthesis protein TsaE